MKSFGRDIRPLFFSDIHCFEYNAEQNNLYLDLLNVVDYSRLYNRYLGIEEKPTLKSINVVEEACASLKAGCPVSIFIDRYHQSTAPMYYKKKHSNHTILVYGYNYEEQYFNIIDDYYFSEDATYVTAKISFEDLQKSYLGFLQYYPEFEQIPSYYQYSYNNKEYEYSENTLLQLEDKYYAELIANKQKLYKGLEKLNQFSQDFISGLSTTEIYEKADYYERMIWWIIQFRKTEKYIYTELKRDGFQTQLDSVIMCWEKIKILLLKIFIRKSITDKIQKSLEVLFLQICNLEKEYLDALFIELI